jgi:hypothetical protein
MGDVEILRFTPIGTAARLLELAAFDASAYGEKDVPPHVLEQWWRAFPAGVRIAEEPDGRIAGAMSGWPLRPDAYDAIVSGTMTEDALTPSHFDLHAGERTRWYISGIAMTDDLRARPLDLIAFLADGLAALGDESRCLAPDICAVATSEEGARMMRRFGFTRRGETPHGVAFEQRAFRDSRIASLARRATARSVA